MRGNDESGFGFRASGFGSGNRVHPRPDTRIPIPDEPMPTASRDIVVTNSMGLHARPAVQFVDLANTFHSSVTVKKPGPDPVEADGKSVMQMIVLEATKGTPLRIEAEGDDAQEAVKKLAELFESGFGEE